MFALIARILWRWEPIGFNDSVGFGYFEKAICRVNSVIMIVIQKVLPRDGVDSFNTFHLFRSQHREVRYVHPFLQCMRVIQKNADLHSLFVVLGCLERWANEKVFIVL